MEDKTPKNESQTEEQKVEEPRKTSTERLADVVIASLERAKTNGGILLNATQKMKPGIYNSNYQMSPFNSAIIAMYSDQNDYKTNLATFFSDAKKNGESVRGGQKGIPFPIYTWNTFQKKDNPDVTISRSEYTAMSESEKAEYKAVRNKSMRIVFNLDQTTLPVVNKEEYAKLLEKNGGVEERTVDANTDKQTRIDVNQFILNVRDNLVKIQKDGNGTALYDKANDVVHVPAQNAYNSYPEYVQDVTRQVIAATAHPQRLNRHSSQNYDTLMTEIASASKQLQYGMPAKLSPKAMENVDAIIDMIKKNPALIESVEKDVNMSISMVQKAERGEKVEKRPTKQELENWRAKLPKEGTVPDRFDAVLMLRDLNQEWTLYVKPENEKGFAVHPTQSDAALFFNFLRGLPVESGETFRMEMAQRYYSEVAQHPEKAVALFGEDTDQKARDMFERVLVFKTREDTPRILIAPTLTTGEKLKPRELNNDQWQLMWLAPDMKEYKKNLAVSMYKDELADKMGEQMSQGQKQELKEPVTLDIPKWSLNYIINGDAEGITDEEKGIVDKFLDEHFADGFIPEVIDGKDKDFNVSPAFGTRNPNALPNKGESPYQAVDTVAVKFSPAGYFETRNEGQEQKTQTEQKPKYDPKSEQEDKECTKLINEIEKIDKKCRAETMPNRQRALFEEKKALEAKLQERVKYLQEQAQQREQKSEQKTEQKSKKPELSPLLKQFLDLKKKHPDALLLFRTGDFYETYKEDAEKASKILGITLTKSSKTRDDQDKPLAMAGFPYHALDAYLPKLIRAGQRVAICDQIEAPRQEIKRGEQPADNAQKQKQEQKQEESHARGFHR